MEKYGQQTLCLILYIIFLLNTFCCSEEEMKKTKVYYLTRDCKPSDGRDYHRDQPEMELGIDLGGAVIFSHESHSDIPPGFDCVVRANAGIGNRVLLAIRQFDIPSEQSAYCQNAVYIYDSNTYMTNAMKQAGGDSGLCNEVKDMSLVTTSSYVTVAFRMSTEGKGFQVHPDSRRRPGFKLVLSAVMNGDSENCAKHHFKCDMGNFCIPWNLVCDRFPNCPDASDEEVEASECAQRRREGKQGRAGGSILSRFFSLGVTASIAIAAGSIILCVVGTAAVVCCCCRRCRGAKPGATGPGQPLQQYCPQQYLQAAPSAAQLHHHLVSSSALTLRSSLAPSAGYAVKRASSSVGGVTGCSGSSGYKYCPATRPLVTTAVHSGGYWSGSSTTTTTTPYTHKKSQPSLGPTSSLMSSLSGSAAIPVYLLASPRPIDRHSARRPSISPPSSPLSFSASPRVGGRTRSSNGGPASPRSAKSAGAAPRSTSGSSQHRHRHRSSRHRRPRSVPGGGGSSVSTSGCSAGRVNMSAQLRTAVCTRPRWVASGSSQSERIEYPVHL